MFWVFLKWACISNKGSWISHPTYSGLTAAKLLQRGSDKLGFLEDFFLHIHLGSELQGSRF